MTPDVLNTLIERDLPAARNGDTVAYGRLVAATQRMVASVAMAITRDLQTSEDIAQDTFLTAWQRIGQLGSASSFLPWLRQVARNRAIDHVRAGRYRETPVDPMDYLADVAGDPQQGPAETFAREYDARQLAEALDEIPETSRDVLLLYYREGERSQSVAGLLGISDAAVRKRLQRGRESLRAELLKRFADAARSSAPGAAFTALLGPMIATTTPATATAAVAGTGAAKSGASGLAAKVSLGTLTGLFAAIGLVLAASVWEMRGYLRKARSPAERRALLHNAIVYCTLMTSYIAVLAWSVFDGWSASQVMAKACGVSLVLFVLTFERRRHQRRHGPAPQDE
jgi:RNA polymerase sigma factor (sigma-70 family)